MARIEADRWRRWVARAEVYPRYLRIPDAARYCGLPTEEVERLCATRDFESFCYKLNPAATHGVRLIVVSSIDLFMDKIARENMPLEMLLPGDAHVMESAALAKARVLQHQPQEASTT
jgi:hypothetical protein